MNDDKCRWWKYIHSDWGVQMCWVTTESRLLQPLAAKKMSSKPCWQQSLMQLAHQIWDMDRYWWLVPGCLSHWNISKPLRRPPLPSMGRCHSMSFHVAIWLAICPRSILQLQLAQPSAWRRSRKVLGMHCGVACDILFISNLPYFWGTKISETTPT